MKGINDWLKALKVSIPIKIILLFIGVIFMYKVYMSRGYLDAFLLASLPLILIIIGKFVANPYKLFYVYFVLNYFIMGINRYHSLKSGLIMLVFSIIILVLIFVKSCWNRENIPIKNCILNPMFLIWLIWFSYCALLLFNPNVYFFPWCVGIGNYAFYALFTIFLISIFFRSYKSVRFFLFLWSICTFVAVFKACWQKFHGFDYAEKDWLFVGGGARTHIIYSGIRYFSLFTDAANFGTSMGMSLIVFMIVAFYTKGIYEKIYYFIIAFGAGYGFMISGTRSAMMVPFAALASYVAFSGKIKPMISGLTVIIGLFVFLNLTTIGNSNPLIRRMRSAFDTSDASLNVRLENQKKFKTYMKDLPFGVGIQMDSDPRIKMPIIATDSWFVKIWVETGIVGLIIHLTLMAILFAWGGYILLFKIHHREVRGVLAAMFAGAIGLFASSYGNEVMGFPNGLLVWICEAFVFVGPYIDEHFEETDLKQNNDYAA